jgi:hypothetical protein
MRAGQPLFHYEDVGGVMGLMFPPVRIVTGIKK